ncbi:hypothetical protein LXL04_007603 [Taraxacum kok-saghyz]
MNRLKLDRREYLQRRYSVETSTSPPQIQRRYKSNAGIPATKVEFVEVQERDREEEKKKGFHPITSSVCFRCWIHARPRNRLPRDLRGGVHDEATEPPQLHGRSVLSIPFGLRIQLLHLLKTELYNKKDAITKVELKDVMNRSRIYHNKND